jgi:hypothetical protein
MRAKMNKYIFTLAILLDSKSRAKKHYSEDTVISDLFCEDGDEIYWILSLADMEIIYGFELPDELFDRTDLTLGEFAQELEKLLLIPNELYEKFFDIKFTVMKLTKRFIEIETKTDEESLRELNEINNQFELLTVRLNVLLGNVLVN